MPSNGWSPLFNRPCDFRRFFRDRSISDAVADTWECDVRVAQGGDILSREDEKKPCCDMLWPKCGRGILNLELTISANKNDLCSCNGLQLLYHKRGLS